MASKKTLTTDTLAGLGAKRLAELLMEVAEADAAVKRRLRLAVATRDAPETIAAEVRKRLAQIARARSFVDWRKTRDLAADLETQRRAIVDQVAKIDASEALGLMWRFMELAGTVYERCDDSNGIIGDVFRVAGGDLGALAEMAAPDPITLADRVFTACNENGYGQYDHLIKMLAPVLKNAGLDHLKSRFVELSKTPIKKSPGDKRTIIGLGADGPIYEADFKARSRASAIRICLQEIADAQGDVDAFVAQYDLATRKVPGIAAKIALRLLAARRAEEALQTLEEAEHTRGDWQDFAWRDYAWDDARIETLDALGRGDEAQAARWSCFESALSAEHLRAHLKRLADFDDVEAEHRALDHAEGYESALKGLAFLVSWPSLDRAARLLIGRTGEIDGNYFEILSPAADSLAGKHPLAATLALRAMIDFTLNKARASRYGHAARHLLACADLASSIEDFATFETHEAYSARLKAEHGRKSGFWSLISEGRQR